MRYENERPPVAVILAAGSGSRQSFLEDTSAKCLLSVGGSVILERLIRNCLSCGISQFVMVLGNRSDEIREYVDKTFRGIRVNYVINDRYRNTNTGYSLMLAAPAIGAAEFIKLDVDVMFDTKILRNLMDSDLANGLCIDRNIAPSDGKVKIIADDQMRVTDIGKSVDAKAAFGGSIGMEKISATTGPLLFAELARMIEDTGQAKDNYEAAYERLIHNGVPFRALDITGLNWTKIDTAEDIPVANAKFGSPVVTVSRGQQRAMDEAAAKPAPQTYDI